MRLVRCALLSLCAAWAALGAPILGSGKQHLAREDKLRDLQALRFPALDAGQPIDGHCFYPDQWTHFTAQAPVPGAPWPPQPPARPCATPAQAVDNRAAPGGGPSPHEQCVNHVIEQWGTFRESASKMERSMMPVVREHLRETRSRTLIDLALANAVHALNTWGHGLIIETEYYLGSFANPLCVPVGTSGEPNWLYDFDEVRCKNLNNGIQRLWGSADYIVRDERNGNRILMVVEGKRLEGINADAESQLVRGLFAAATANFRGERNQRGMHGVANPHPAAGNEEHVAGVLSDGARCHTRFLCGNRLNDDTVDRIPLATGIEHNRVEEPFKQNLSCFLYGLVYALHGGVCAQ